MHDDFFYPLDSDYHASVDGQSFVRILHAAPGAPAVDVYANNVLIVRNLTYRQFTQYLPLFPGRYRIVVFPAGSRTSPVIDATLSIPAGTIYTAAAIGTLPNLRLLPIADPCIARGFGQSYVRFVHLSPNTPAVDIATSTGVQLFRNVSYTQVTDYIPVQPGLYTLEARPAGTNQVVLTVPNVRIAANRILSVYAIGLSGGQPSLQVLIPLDGNAYLPVCRFTR
ncbi:DUF4397 domain-containing protein [Heliobacillus mobilis]|uniref:DUF4397 domain-containing protein n=1 Tax=Heliobacterium mobile TaxID=28064 RepID=A0A6I3SBB7_HELMO|nr:DUF4397 domain-containing protein [Heliobacterium mobile]MTV47572.1 DUF4397 domain-containing protein [Heliobacterium mobile]